MAKIKPLSGQVLVELLPTETRSAGGIDLPNRTLSPEEVQERHANPEKPQGLIGIVKAIGPWPKLPNGMQLLPEYGLNARVIINPNRGTLMQWDTSRRLKMVQQEDVLAVVEI